MAGLSTVGGITPVSYADDAPLPINQTEIAQALTYDLPPWPEPPPPITEVLGTLG